MAKVYRLDTATKGTGASVVPLERDQDAPRAPREPVYVPPKPRPRPPAAPKARAPRRFRVVDVVSGETRAQDASLREIVDLLASVRSVVDVRIHVFDDATGDWRLLTLGEQRALWDAGRRLSP